MRQSADLLRERFQALATCLQDVLAGNVIFREKHNQSQR